MTGNCFIKKKVAAFLLCLLIPFMLSSQEIGLKYEQKTLTQHKPGCEVSPLDLFGTEVDQILGHSQWLVPQVSFLISDCIDPVSGQFVKLPEGLSAAEDPLYFTDKDGNYLKGEVYGKNEPSSFCQGKIKSLKGPRGKGGEEILLLSIRYWQRGDLTLTVVQNCRGLTTIYSISEGRVEQASLYLGAIEDPFCPQLKPYRQDLITWEKSGEGKWLISSIATYGDFLVKENRYRYDHSGRLIESALISALTGRSDTLEKYGTYYSYLVDGRVQEIREDNGKRIQLTYEEGSLSIKPEAIYLFDTKLGDRPILRRFYRYDAWLRPVEVITDDGVALAQEDLAGVTERHIRRCHYREELSALNFSETIEESIYFPERSLEKLTGKKIRHVAQDHESERQDFYDSEGQFLYSLYREETGSSLQLKRSGGKVSRYEKSRGGKTVREESSSSPFKLSYRYDKGGRLTVKEGFGQEAYFKERYLWDPFNALLHASDHLGAETDYHLDSLGRPLLIEHPLIVTLKGTERPQTERRYDLLDNVIWEKDPLGYVKETVYNGRSQPLKVLYPDGSWESFTYELDGSLSSHRDRLGLTTVYQRDLFGRPLLEERLLENGALDSQTLYSYTPFHLLMKKEGETLFSFAYDDLGRLALMKVEHPFGGLQERYRYDRFSNQVESVKESAENKGQEGTFLSAIQRLYDAEGRVVDERIFAHRDDYIAAKSAQEVQTFYTPYGLPERVIRQNNSGAFSSNAYLYDERGRLILEEESGKKTLYRYSTVAYKGILAERKEALFFDGQRKVTLSDRLGHQLREEHYDFAGQLLYAWEGELDLMGHLALEKVTRLGPQGEETVQTYRLFGPLDRLEQLSEAYQSPDERTTRYQFNGRGQLEKMIKPSGIALHYEWNELGQLVHLSSSDLTVDQDFSWDCQLHELKVYDHVQQRFASRCYNEERGLQKEQLANGLTLSYDYNREGQKRAVWLPDGSSIRYSYHRGSLCAVERLDLSDQVRYQHRYRASTAVGDGDRQLFQSLEILPFDVGSLEVTFSADGHLLSLISPYHQDSCLERSKEGAMTARLLTDPLGREVRTYAYDALNHLAEESGSFQAPSDQPTHYDNLGNSYRQEARYNLLNEKIGDARFDYRYDLDGNLLAMGDLLLSYDALNRLKSVTKKGEWQEVYSYDFLDRRMDRQRLIWDKQGSCWQLLETALFFYDGEEEIGSTNEKGEIQAVKVLGQSSYSPFPLPVAIERGAEVYIPLLDRQGSLVALIDRQKQWLEVHRYSAFGEVRSISEGEILSPWLYRSKRADDFSGAVYFGKRYYLPEMQRWLTKDPCGFQDGPNLYAYLKGSPLEKGDFQGLFSLSTALLEAFDGLTTFFQKATYPLDLMASFIAFDTYYMQSACEKTEVLAQQIFGQFTLFLIGYQIDPPEMGIWGDWNLSNRLRITAINGILNSRADCIESVECVSRSLGGAKVHYVYHASEGFTRDIIKCMLAKMGFTTQGAAALAELWQKLAHELKSEEGGLIIHYAHSLGGADTLQASRIIPKHVRKMIRIITFGSAALIEPDGFESVRNYVCRRDGIPLGASPINYIRSIWNNSSHVIFLGSFHGIPLIDHLFSNGQYNLMCLRLGPQFLEEFGLVPF